MKIPAKQILLVESHGDTVEMLRLYFGYANYQVTATDNCDECLKLARTGRFNLYLLGDGREDVDAFELCRKIRVLDSDTPIVFCTAYARPADRERGMRAGAQAYLTKPCEFDKLAQTIKQLIAKAPAKARWQKRVLRARAN